MVRLRKRKEERRAAAKLASGVLYAARSEDGFSSAEAFADGVVLGGHDVAVGHYRTGVVQKPRRRSRLYPLRRCAQFALSSRRRAMTWAWISAAPSKIERAKGMADQATRPTCTVRCRR